METPNQKTKDISSISLAVVSSLLPFACCWGPSVFAGVAMLSGFTGSISLLHEYKPWLYGISFLSLGYSFYRLYFKLQKSSDDCKRCSTVAVSFPNLLSKIYLWVAAVMIIGLFVINRYPEILLN